MDIVKKTYNKIFWPVFFVIFILIFYTASFFVYKTILTKPTGNLDDSNNAINEATKRIKEISGSVNEEKNVALEPLEYYLKNRKCGNGLCEYGEDSKICPADCSVAELKKETWVQVNGPYGGYITDLKKVENTLFAATAYNQGPGGNGIYKISRDGLTWEALGGTTKATFQLSINYNDKDNLAFISEGVLYVTTDGGKTWKKSKSPGGTFRAVAFSKANSSLLFSSTEHNGASNFHVSNDNGESWTEVSALPDSEWSIKPIWAGISDASKNYVKIIYPHPTDENLIFVGTNSALFKSDDRGKSWKRVDDSFHRTDIMDIAINPQNTNEVYVRVGLFEEFVCMGVQDKKTEKEKCAGVYKSTDMGETWEQMDAFYFDPSEGGVFIDEYNPDIAYAIFSRKIFKTDDAGKNWKEFFWTHNEPFISNSGLERLVVGKNSNELYIAGRQGLWHTEDSGEHWDERNKGFVGSEVVDIVKAIDGTLYAGTYSLGMLKSTDGGQSWTFASYNLENSYIMLIAAHPTNEKTLFVTTNGGIYASYDSALTWKRIGKEFFGESELLKEVSHFHGIAFDPQNPQQIYIGGGGDQYTPKGSGIIISSDGGRTWRESNKGFVTDVHVSKIVVDKKNSAIVYATTQGATNFQEKTGSGHGVFKSTDYGNTWKKINNGLKTVETNTLAIDPNNNNVLYLGTDNDGLYKSIDGGDTWEKIVLNKLPEEYGIGDIVIDPQNSNTIYIGTVDYFRLFVDRGLVGDYGVYVSYDGGKSWDTFNEGLNHDGIFSLEIDTEERILYAGTRGGGVYWRKIGV